VTTVNDNRRPFLPGGQGSRLERAAVLRHGLFNKPVRHQASLKNVPLCEVPVLTATPFRSRRAVLTLFSVLEAVLCKPRTL